MKPIISLFFLLLVLFSSSHANEQRVEATLVTNQGHIVLELYPDKAPITVANFLNYSQQGFYQNTLLHRIIPDFMVQGGGYSVDLEKKETLDPIKNEADNGLLNLRGTVAMSRSSEPDSATSQFFINVNNNSFLDHKAKTPTDWGYTVFGRVISGMDVVDKIQTVPTGAVPPHFSRHAPLTPVVLENVLLNETATRWLASPDSVELIPTAVDDLLEHLVEDESPETTGEEQAAASDSETAETDPVETPAETASTAPSVVANQETESESEEAASHEMNTYALDAPTSPDQPEPYPAQN